MHTRHTCKKRRGEDIQHWRIQAREGVQRVNGGLGGRGRDERTELLRTRGIQKVGNTNLKGTRYKHGPHSYGARALQQWRVTPSLLRRHHTGLWRPFGCGHRRRRRHRDRVLWMLQCMLLDGHQGGGLHGTGFSGTTGTGAGREGGSPGRA